MTHTDLDKAIKARKIWQELYKDHDGFISAEGSSGIHLTNEAFFEMFFTDDITESPRDCKVYPIEYSAIYKGERFFCIGEKRGEDE